MDSLVAIPRVTLQRHTEIPNIPPVFVGDVTHDSALALNRNPTVVSFVDGLLMPRRPSAIFGFVMPVIVNALNGMFPRWARTHVSKKNTEIHHPRFAHANPSTSVARITSAASRLYSTPAYVLWRVMCVGRACASVLALRFAGSFFMQTAAALRVTGSEIRSVYNFFPTAIAKAFPQMHLSVFGMPPNNQQPVKALSLQVYQLHTRIL